MPPKKTGWQFFIDRGGTFTDIVARGPDGLVLTHKLLSDSPRHYADAAAYGIRWLLARHGAADDRVDAVRMGTTLATNALLERRGARTGLVITRGFRDALRIGYQNRPHLFRRRIELPGPLYAHVVEVDERIDADGAVLRPLDVGQLRAALSTLRERGIESVAIVFMHGYRYPTHERAAAALAREAGFAEVCASHAVSPLIRLVSRGDTTVADAYLTPLLKRYVAQFSAELGAGLLPARLSFMQSNGGLAEAAAFRGANAVLSGPAGGVVGMVRAGEALGRGRLIGFDMGGTSTDVALYDGEYPRRFDTTIAGVRLQAPMMNIHTVAAGGGSVLRFASGRLQVGPDSAGAHPGPACYRNGGPLTVTDANVLLGRVRAAHFPRVFGPAGSDPLDADVVGQRFAAMAAEVGAATGRTMAPEALAAGFLEVAVDAMANAIRHVSVRQGRDAAGYTLVCFGGAGGQHACRVAAALGMREILIHPLAGVLSAWGIGLADQRVLRRASLERPFARETLDGVLAALAALSRESVSELEGQGTPPAAIRVDARVELRASGTEMSLPVAAGSFDAMLAEFLATFQRRFGFAAVPTQVTVAAVRAEAVAPGGYAGSTTVRAAPADPEPAMPASGGTGAARETEGAARVRAWFDGWQEVALFRRDRVTAGTTIVGPAILAEDTTTTVVEPGWEARALDAGELLLVRTGADGRPRDGDTALDPVRLEVFNHRFMHIAEQMGAVLEATAVSVNIRERLDFSCAVFDPTGALIANAPHMPVHLGSMGASVRAVLEARGGRMRPGDAWLINDPYTGGTHLPDVTLVTPVFLGCGPRPEFFVASRAHHADIGGTTPGSMPPMSHTIEEEGVLFDGFQLLEAGVLREDALRAVLTSGPWPARNPQQSIADLKAQVAANARGAEELARLVAEQGAATVRAYMRYVQDNAEAAVREVIDRLRDGSFRCELDSGRAVAVSVRVDHAARRAVIDFTGTSPQTDDNFNAPRAVCTAAVLYVFRTLVDSDIPLNEGCLRPLEIIIPEGTMLSPRAPAAVVAGNVETSQCIVDALYGALGCLAASQGTMNNLTFGNERYQYYETIAGGAGAGPGFDGASGVQTHMTNSRLTDPEVLESRYPVLLREFSIRAGSGGAGRHRGGDGLVRRIEFREPMTAAILSNRRRIAPFGLDGGSDASTGVNRVLRADGRVQELPATAEVTVEPGDQLEILTPGGGGFGAP